MNKAWEPLKHLEEGGKIHNEKIYATFDFEGFKNCFETEEYAEMETIFIDPDSWKIEKPKKKIKLYAWLDLNSEHGQLFWKHENLPAKGKAIRVKCEDKDIEVDE